LSSFHQGLRETGYVENRNVIIEYRWAEGKYDRLPELARDLIRRGVAVIAATSTPANRIAKAATTSIPIVFTTSSDPVELGLVASLSHPGGNVTGAVTMNVELGTKRLELSREVIPRESTILVLANPRNPNFEAQLGDLHEAARTLGQPIRVVTVGSETEIDAAFERLAQQRAGAIIVTDALLFSRRNQLVDLAKRYAVPAIFDRREFTAAGGLMSYGGSVTDIYRLAGVYAGRILKGEKPADLPVQQATKVELVINLETAKALGLTFPLDLLGRADEVIE
jgi:putative ABC transport system substrate-binding protein